MALRRGSRGRVCCADAWDCGLATSGKTDAGLWELGLVTGKKRSQMVCLRADEALELVAGQNAVPLAELVRFGADGYSVD